MNNLLSLSAMRWMCAAAFGIIALQLSNVYAKLGYANERLEAQHEINIILAERIQQLEAQLEEQ